jgi:hypothetical protein
MKVKDQIKTELTKLEDYGKYYNHTFYCSNCKERNYRYILKGIRINTVSFNCENCGCIISEK